MLGLGLQLFRRAGVLGSSAFARIWNIVTAKWNNSTQTWDA